MKILHVATHLNTGGITTYLLTLVREQSKAGHEVSVWASQGTRREDFTRWAQVISDVPRCKSELSPRLWMQLPKFVSFLKTNSIEMVHTHTRVAQVLTAAATHFVKVPYISTAHMFYKARLGRRLFPCWGHSVLAISDTMRKGLISIFGQRNLPPVHVVLNSIDVNALCAKVAAVDRTAVRAAWGCKAEHVVVLALSRLVPVKGVHFLIEAFGRVYPEFPNLRLWVAGTGDEAYLQQLKNQVKTLRLESVVYFLGNISEIEKPFKGADIFVAPYLWPEAFGLSILEAMVSGLPVIGSNSGGIAELLGHGSRGLVFEEGDVEQLIRCVWDYVRSPELRAKMRQAASLAALDYSSEKMYQSVQKIYEGVIQQI